MKRGKVLITGASVAGCTAAWWMARSGWNVTVVEKSPGFRDGGQNVDIRGDGREVLRYMGLEERAFALSTREKGIEWVDERDQAIASFPIDHKSDRGPTAELEIRRGDIATLLFEEAKKKAEFRFGKVIDQISDRRDHVDVKFNDGTTDSFDLVIVAEGVGSTTRELVFPGENVPRYLGFTIAYFSVPRESRDRDYARQYQTTEGRGASLKVNRDQSLGAYLGIQKKPDVERGLSTEQQKQFVQNRFQELGWEVPRLLEQMWKTDDFYFEVLRQVRLPRWSKGKVALLGDAAWCPTPLSGIGTTLAIVGAYILAGELSVQADLAAALKTYEKRMRPFVKVGQDFPKIVPKILWPHTKLGVRGLRAFMRVLALPGIRELFIRNFAGDPKAIQLPSYDRGKHVALTLGRA